MEPTHLPVVVSVYAYELRSGDILGPSKLNGPASEVLSVHAIDKGSDYNHLFVKVITSTSTFETPRESIFSVRR